MRTNISLRGEGARSLPGALAILALLAGLRAAPAGAVELSVSVDRRITSPGEPVILTVTVSGARPSSSPSLPPLDQFRVSGPSTSTRIEVAGGRTSVSRSYEYTLYPLKTGNLTIGPIRVESNAGTYKTKPISIEVAEGGRGGQRHIAVRDEEGPSGSPRRAAGREMFIELSTDRRKVYIHEQVTLRFRFYYSDVRLAEQPSYEAPQAEGFMRKSLRGGEARTYSRVIGGRLYQVLELDTALFPYKTGKLSIGPARLRGSLLVASARRARRFGSIFDDFFEDPFFGHFGKKPFELVSNKVEIEVEPLPAEGAPGGEVSVGSYVLSVEAKPRKVRVGDPITVTMRVSGEGDLETVAPPRIESLEAFKSYEATSSTEAKAAGDRIEGVKIFEQVLVPLKESVREIPPVEFDYFDPAKRRYVALKKGPLPITVLPAKEKPSAIISLPVQARGKGVKLLERNIVFIKTAPGRLSKGGSALFRLPLFWIAQCLPLAALLIAVAHHRHRTRLRCDRGYARSRSAGKLIRKRLKSVEGALRSGDAEAFYSGIVRAVNRYVADRLDIPPGGLTPEIVREKLQERGVPEEVLERLGRFYEECELARFASARIEGERMRDAYREAGEILAALKGRI